MAAGVEPRPLCFMAAELIDILVVSPTGEKVGTEKLDPATLGGRVRHQLLKQAVVAYRAAQRQGTVQTKSRAMVHGASKKLYRQKGTGRARAGNLRTPVRRGGGHAFAKINRDFTQKLSKKMRRLARDSAILAKAISGTAMIVKGLNIDTPKTKKLAAVLKATKTQRGALLATEGAESSLLLSGRNIPNFGIKQVGELNAYEVLRARHLLFTPQAFASLVKGETAKPAPAAKKA